MSTASKNWNEKAAPLFAALGDPTRLKLLTQLGEKESDITSLCADAEISRQAITKHLTVLARAGLISDRREGRQRFWKARPQRLDEAHHYLEQVSEQWGDALQRLASFLETEDIS